MPDHLPSIVQKMLRHEHVLDRMSVAKEIFQSLESDIDDFGPIEKVLKKHFISRLKVCALHRDAAQTAIVILLANFYVKNYQDFIDDFPAAA
ncbi:hypothetical protein FLLO111716_08120 [Flavobacterium longum]|uniref:hypothetical protein n=1 Tax=Flavobacterium longum TaxID=1299340 RepID=UPI0039EC2737